MDRCAVQKNVLDCVGEMCIGEIPYVEQQMTDAAQTIWKAFCGELTQEPTDDMREALATAIREVANELQYYNTSEGEDMILDAYKLYELSDELEGK
jgi:hypothetical protein